MVSRIFQIIALSILACLISSCSDDECPTCNEQIETVFVCSGSFSEAEVSGPESFLSMTAGFVGSPVPHIRSFKWLGNELEPCDQGLPCYDGRIASPYQKNMDVIMVIEFDTISLELLIPDPFYLIYPPVGTTVLPADVALELTWSKCPDAEQYRLRTYVFFDTESEMFIELDSSFATTDTTATIPAVHMQSGRSIYVMLLGGKGVAGEPGDVVNYSQGNFRGFLNTGYETRGITALIQ